MSNKFNFFVGCDISEEDLEKAKKAKGEDRYDNMIVEGLASDDSIDQEGQSLLPSGYDFSHFLTKGLINLEHYTSRKANSKYWIGEPIAAHVKGEQFFVKAKLWKKSPEARDFYDKIIEMKESGSTRKPGFSIEGKSIEKDPFNPNKILKAKILNMAVTMSPVNSNSWLDISKGNQTQDYVEAIVEGTQLTPSYLLQYELEDGSILTINKDMSINIVKPAIRKAMDVASIKPLMPESLEKKVINLETTKQIVKSIEQGRLSNEFAKNLFKMIINNEK